MENQEFQKIVLEELRSIKGDINEIKQDVTTLKKDVTSLKEDVSTLKKDVNGLKKDVSGVKKDISALKEGQESMKEDIRILKSQTGENTQILQALMHASEVHKAENDKLNIDIAKTQGEVVALRKDLIKLKAS